MKDKNVAGILALFLGWAGIHRFYLGQVGLGIFYAILMFTGISAVLGLIDAVAFFLMDQETFDRKYNRSRRWDNRRQGRDQRYQEWRDRQDVRRKDWQNRSQTPPSRAAAKANPFKQSGIRKFKEYDYKGAIEDFEKALEMDEKDIAIHFNLACAYSLEENLEKSLYHLDRAVAYGFKDFDRIRSHDAFAFIRIQKEFAAFEANKYRTPKESRPSAPAQPVKGITEEETDLLSTQPDLLDQIRKLGELREKGLLTEEEFAEQKRKLMG
jgi:TM2 domain-containing membrane protein YozV